MVSKKMSEDVQEMRKEELRRIGGRGKAGDVVRWPELTSYRRRAAEQNGGLAVWC